MWYFSLNDLNLLFAVKCVASYQLKSQTFVWDSTPSCYSVVRLITVCDFGYNRRLISYLPDIHQWNH